MSGFSMRAGDSRVLEITVRNAEGNAVDLTGATVTWQASTEPFGAPSIEKNAVVTNAAQGILSVTLDPADTAALAGQYFQVAVVVDEQQNRSTVYLGIMSISAPGALSVEEFKARFPEFAPVSATTIAMVLAEAVGQVGDSWIERDRKPAQLYLAAHLLAVEGEPARTTTGAGMGTAGPVKRRKVGDVEVEFAGNGGGSSGGAASGYMLTSYGQRYLHLLRMNFPPVAVV